MDWITATTVTLTLLTGCSSGQVLPPGPLTGAVGGNVTFKTTISSTGPELLTIAWSFNDGSGPVSVIGSSPGGNTSGPGYEGRLSLNRVTGSLELRQLTLRDSGPYSVVLTSGTGATQNGQTTLNVYEKISGASITGPTEVLIAGNSSAKLSCQAAAGTIISRKWLKDGHPLSPSNRITFSGDNSSVSIDPLQGTDNGQYQCRLTNPVSTDSVSYYLTVNFSAGPNSESQLGAILGGTFGALGCVAVAGGALAYMKKRKRRDSPSNQDHQAAVYENTIDLSPPVVYGNLPTGSTDLPCPVDSENRPDYEELQFKDTATYSNLNSI